MWQLLLTKYQLATKYGLNNIKTSHRKPLVPPPLLLLASILLIYSVTQYGHYCQHTMRAFCFSGGDISSHQLVSEQSLEGDLGTLTFLLTNILAMSS